MKTIEEQAESVAAWLDVRYPDWYKKIDITDFDVGYECQCVGHYLGIYWGKLKNQLINDIGSEQYYENFPVSSFAASELTEHYINEIKARRARDLATREREMELVA